MSWNDGGYRPGPGSMPPPQPYRPPGQQTPLPSAPPAPAPHGDARPATPIGDYPAGTIPGMTVPGQRRSGPSRGRGVLIGVIGLSTAVTIAIVGVFFLVQSAATPDPAPQQSAVAPPVPTPANDPTPTMTPTPDDGSWRVSPAEVWAPSTDFASVTTPYPDRIGSFTVGTDVYVRTVQGEINGAFARIDTNTGDVSWRTTPGELLLTSCAPPPPGQAATACLATGTDGSRLLATFDASTSEITATAPLDQPWTAIAAADTDWIVYRFTDGAYTMARVRTDGTTVWSTTSAARVSDLEWTNSNGGHTRIIAGIGYETLTVNGRWAAIMDMPGPDFVVDSTNGTVIGDVTPGGTVARVQPGGTVAVATGTSAFELRGTDGNPIATLDGTIGALIGRDIDSDDGPAIQSSMPATTPVLIVTLGEAIPGEPLRRTLTALDPTSAMQLWSIDLAPNDEVRAWTASAVVIGSDSTITSVDSATGSTRWSVPMDLEEIRAVGLDEAGTSVVLANGTTATVLSLDDGSMIWSGNDDGGVVIPVGDRIVFLDEQTLSAYRMR